MSRSKVGDGCFSADGVLEPANNNINRDHSASDRIVDSRIFRRGEFYARGEQRRVACMFADARGKCKLTTAWDLRLLFDP